MLNVTNEEFEKALSDINNKRIINSAQKPYKDKIDEEELKHLGYMALYNCLKSHDSNKGNKFTSSLYFHTSCQCMKMLRQRKRKPQMSSMPAYYDLEYVVSPEVMLVRDCIDTLPDHHSRILKYYYVDKRNLKEIGEIMKCTAPAAFKKLRNAKEAFRILYDVD